MSPKMLEHLRVVITTHQPMYVHNHLVAKHLALAQVEAGHVSLTETSHHLGLSYRQTLRWWQRYREAAGSLIELAALCPPRGGGNRLRPDVAQAVLDHKKQRPHRSVAHIAEAVSEERGSVSASTVRRLLQSADLLEVGEKPARAFTRFEAQAFGERLQMDTTSGAWLSGYRLIYLIAILDDYSRMLVGWWWVGSDSTWNNMSVLRETIEKWGLPQTLYTDNASLFKTIRHDKSIYQHHRQEGYETEIQRAMSELGVTMFSHKPYEPQSKGKIERFFRFMQERFVREHTATTLAELNQQFAPWARWYNTRHKNRCTGQMPQDRTTPSAFGPVPGERRLESAFCWKTTRRVDKSNAIHLLGAMFTIDHANVLVHRTVDIEYTMTEVRVYHHGQFVQRFTTGEVCPTHVDHS